MIDMTYWCESCARKNNCYTIRSRPKCFTPITSNDRTADRKTEPSIDIIRCKDCDNYAGEGMYCAWNVLTGDMGYCHHARPKGSTDITAEQTEPTVSKMEQVDKDINVRSKDEPQTEREGE